MKNRDQLFVGSIWNRKKEPECCPCPDISADADNIIECRTDGLYATAEGGVGSAINGLSVSGDNIVLGQDFNAVGNPATFISDRQIPFGGNHLALTNGTLSLNYTTPPLTHFLIQEINGTSGVGPESMGFPVLGLNGNLHGTSYVMHGPSNHGFVIGRIDNSISGANLSFYRSGGTNAAVRTAVNAGQLISRIAFHAVTSDSLNVALSGSITCQVAATAPTYVACNYQFITTNLTGANFAAMVLTANGNLLLDGLSTDNESKLNVRQSNTGATAYRTAQFLGTWNTTGAPTLIYGNITDTLSDAASLLLDLQVGGSSVFKVGKAISEYADNTAATTAGLTIGAIYRTADVLKIVHA